MAEAAERGWQLFREHLHQAGLAAEALILPAIRQN
jgi:hypothetical protein